MFQNILVSIDGSRQSECALDVAVDVARQYQASLHLVHAVLRECSIDDLREIADRMGMAGEVSEELSNVEIVPAGFAPGADVPIVVVPETALEKIGTLLLEKARKKASDAGLREVRSHVMDEEPAQGILAYADGNDVDLIVTGSRGRGPLKTLILGSVSHDLIEGSQCPCLVVKADES